METVGIIGGLGPSTTAQFYLELIALSQGSSVRPPVLIWSVPASYEDEHNAIQNGAIEIYLPRLIQAAKILERGGSQFLVMPCNSLHLFIDQIKKAVTVPVISILDVTAEYLSKHSIARVGLLSTSITQEHGLYERCLKSKNITYIHPSKENQSILNKIIHNVVTGCDTDEDKKFLANIIDGFRKKGIEHVVLACTDLQLLKPAHPQLEIHDTMKILAEATFEKILRGFG
ncbi:MAG: amino acid racemase [bacterium]|nr:amino acid racemase [bacterium]